MSPGECLVTIAKAVQLTHQYTNTLAAMLARYYGFYRTMLSIRGTSHGPVTVRLSVRHKWEFY